MEVKLYVGNLAYSTTEGDLQLLFAQAGQVTSVDVIKDRDSGRSKGFAFVTMGTQAGAQKAVGMFHEFPLADRELKVNLARTKAYPARTGEERGGYQSRLSAFGKSGSPTPSGPRRRSLSQRY